MNRDGSGWFAVTYDREDVKLSGRCKAGLTLQEFWANLSQIHPSQQSEEISSLGCWSVRMLGPDYLVMQRGLQNLKPTERLADSSVPP